MSADTLNRFPQRRSNITALLTFAKHHDGNAEGGDVFQNLWLGCTIAAFSNIVIAAGLNVQKYTHMKLTGSGNMTISHNRTPVGASASACAEHAANNTVGSSGSIKYWRYPLWWLGIALLVIGEMGNFVAYGVAPASAVAPLGITCVIANVAIARIFLKETLRTSTLIGSFIGVSGAVLLVLFIAKENDTIFDPKGVEAAVTQPYFVLYLTGLAVALVVLFLLYYIQRQKSLLIILFIANILAAITVITAKAVSGFAVLFLRGSLSLFGLLSQPVFYFLVLCVIVTGITQVKYVQDALALYPATFVVPVNYILFTLSAITAGIIFYGELLGLGEINIIIFIVGCVLCFAGVFLITDDGRACAAIHHNGSSQIAEMSTSYGGQLTVSSSNGAVGTTNVSGPSQNRVITLLRDCVKITQTKFELQPLLHSSPAPAQAAQQQAQQQQLQQEQQLVEIEKKEVEVNNVYESETRVSEPSPISKHLTITGNFSASGVTGELASLDKTPNFGSATFATLSPARGNNNEVPETSLTVVIEKQQSQCPSVYQGSPILDFPSAATTNPETVSIASTRPVSSYLDDSVSAIGSLKDQKLDSGAN